MKEHVDVYRIGKQQGKLIEKYTVRIREMYRKWWFDKREEEMQRMVFVVSVADYRVRTKITEDKKDLLFADAIDKTRTFVETLSRTFPMRLVFELSRSEMNMFS